MGDRPKRKDGRPEALTQVRVAEILGVHVCTVRRWVKRRYILAYRVGINTVLIPRTEISRLRRLRADRPWDGYNGNRYHTV